MTKEERDHLIKIKEWASGCREALKQVKASPMWSTLEKIAPQGGVKGDLLLDNVDWLIAVLERDDKALRHRQGVRALVGAVEGYKTYV